jgi:hypothetical protein
LPALSSARQDVVMVAAHARGPVVPPQEPMLARPATVIPAGSYAVEPKFDRYRGILFVDADGCLVQSRAGHDITRSFPDIGQAAREQLPPGTVVAGELVVWAAQQGCLDFAALQRRIIPPAQLLGRPKSRRPSWRSTCSLRPVKWTAAHGPPYAAREPRRRLVTATAAAPGRPPTRPWCSDGWPTTPGPRWAWRVW